MPILSTSNDDILESDAIALVNPVNCVGIMGKGLAKQFAHKYPALFTAYKQYCAQGLLNPGGLYIYEREYRPNYIINIATKNHWRDNSKIEWIQSGLESIKTFVLSKDIDSIAIPKIGCGLGGLEWHTVRHLIKESFSGMETIVIIYD